MEFFFLKFLFGNNFLVSVTLLLSAKLHEELFLTQFQKELVTGGDLNHSLVLDYGGGGGGVRMEFYLLFYFFVSFCASKTETANVTVFLGRVGSIKNVPCECAIKDHIPLSS